MLVKGCRIYQNIHSSILEFYGYYLRRSTATRWSQLALSKRYLSSIRNSDSECYLGAIWALSKLYPKRYPSAKRWAIQTLANDRSAPLWVWALSSPDCRRVKVAEVKVTFERLHSSRSGTLSLWRISLQFFDANGRPLVDRSSIHVGDQYETKVVSSGSRRIREQRMLISTGESIVVVDSWSRWLKSMDVLEGWSRWTYSKVVVDSWSRWLYS